MWIELLNTDSTGRAVTSRLKDPGTGDYVTFSDNGKAQVTRAVGERVTDAYPAAQAVEADSDADSGADSDDDDDTSDGTDEE